MLPKVEALQLDQYTMVGLTIVFIRGAWYILNWEPHVNGFEL